MDESILNTIKKMLGIESDVIEFDTEIIICINSAIANLSQLGVGPDDGFEILDKTTIWSNYLNNKKLLNNVKTCIFLKTKLLWDPPANSFVVESYNKQITENEFRINVIADNGGDNLNVEV